VPDSASGGSSFHYAGFGVAYNPSNNSLFLSGHINEYKTAEIGIPAPSASPDRAALPVAPLLQSFVDPSEGKSGAANCGADLGSPLLLGGYLVFNGKLFFDGYRYYDGSGCQTHSHFSRPLNLSTQGQVVGAAPLNSGFKAGPVSGPMGMIPPEWQSLLGGPAIATQCCIPIIGRTSFGPDFYVWDPNALNVSGTPATPLMFYDSTHPLSAFDRQSTWFNGSSHMHGVVFPVATRSVLYFGRQGTGSYCYGYGVTSNPPSPAVAADGVQNCYDPTDDAKGNHAYPYISQVWAYDANDLLAVKQGAKQMWEPKPYATWSLQSVAQPFFSGAGDLNGAAYDPATGRIFITQGYGDGDLPVVYVFALGPLAPAPSAPTSVRLITQ
jgi:hypothetical protein